MLAHQNPKPRLLPLSVVFCRLVSVFGFAKLLHFFRIHQIFAPKKFFPNKMSTAKLHFSNNAAGCCATFLTFGNEKTRFYAPKFGRSFGKHYLCPITLNNKLLKSLYHV